MNYRIPGILSIVLLFVTAGIAGYQLFTVSTMLGIAFVIALPLSFLSTFYFYCRKCPHALRGTCRHVVMGWTVSKLFKLSEPSEYTVIEMIYAFVPAAVVIIIAQYWLVQNIKLFTVFWMLMLVTGVIIRTSVCRECENTYCKMCPNGQTCNKYTV